MKSYPRRWILRTTQVAVVALVLFFIGRSVAALWPEMAALEWRLSPVPLAGAFLAGIGCQVLLVVGWRLSLSLVGADITWQGAATSQVLGQLAKYVPGKILTLVGKAYLASRAGVPESRAVLAMFVEATAQVTTALAVGSAYVTVVRPSHREFVPVAALVVLVGCGLLHPALLPRLIRAVLARVGREAPPFDYRLSGLVPLVACYLAFWAVTGVGLRLLGSGLGLRIPLLALTAAYAVSWAAGFLSLIFPGGLGIREYALSQLLGPAAEAGAAMSIALASRGWILAVELLVGCVVWAYQTTAAFHGGRTGAEGDRADSS